MNFSKVQFGQDTGLKSDSADFEAQSNKPLKYYTTNWFAQGKDLPGVNFTEGFGVSQKFIDSESTLKRSTITNPRVRQNFNQLPYATYGGLMSNGPVVSEEISREKKSCQPMSDEYYNRSFYTLNTNPNKTENYGKHGTDTRQIGKSSNQ